MIRLFLTSLLILPLLSCKATTHSTHDIEIGKQISIESIPSKPVEVVFTKVKAADWKIDLAGLVNLEDKKAIDAKLENRLEPTQIYFYVIDHPTKGRYLIDSGVSKDITNDTDHSPIPWLMKKMMGFEHLKVAITTEEFVKSSKQIKGIFLTHMHLDHIMGMTDLPKNISIYVGPGEATFEHARNIGTQGVTNDLFRGHQMINQLTFEKPSGELSTIDFFEDGSLKVLWSPGHTVGSLAFVVNTKGQDQLIVGDTCHTSWGWKNSVTPGEFTIDHKSNQKSLDSLIRLSQKLNLKVHLGHQELKK